MWTEQNVLKVDMEGVCVMLIGVMWEMLWMLYIWYVEGEGMCTGYRYGTALYIVMKSTV
jgi:hypothetical protein